MEKIKSLIKYAKGVVKTAKKKGKPLARKILDESIKLERLMEKEAKKALAGKKRVKKKRKVKRRKR